MSLLSDFDREGEAKEALRQGQNAQLAVKTAITALSEHTQFLAGALSPEAMYIALKTYGYSDEQIIAYGRELLA